MRTRTEAVLALARAPGLWLVLGLILVLAAGIATRQGADEGNGRGLPASGADPPGSASEGGLPFFGFNELAWATIWQQGPPPDPDRAMRRAIEATAAAGANTDRLPVPWLDVVDASGGWDEEAWSRYSDAYRAMVAAGISPVIVLYAAPRGGTDELNPDWAPPGCEGGLVSPPDHAHDAEWQAYVVRASNEFDRALGLQVWNEPNSRDYWGGERCAPNAARYLELAALARDALSGPGSEHPDRVLVSAGLNPSTVPGSIEWREFLREAIGGGLLDDVQAVGIHLYPQRGACGRGRDAPIALAGGAVRQLDEAAALVGGSAPLWVTELGFSSAAGATLDCRALTETDQARALAATYDALAASPNVELAIVHQLVDDPGSYPEQYPNRFGVTRAPPRFLEPKLAYRCLAARRGVGVRSPPACE